MNLDDPVPRSDEGVLVNLSMLSGPCFGDFPASESSVTMRMIDIPPLSLESLHQVNAPGYASDGLPSKLLSNHVYSPQEPQDIHKQTLAPDVYADRSSDSQQPTRDFNISELSGSNVKSSIVCATMHDLDAVTRQTTRHYMSNCSPGDQLTDVVYSPIDNKLLTHGASNVYSGSSADSDLAAMTGSSDLDMPQSEVPDLQRVPALSSLPGPLSAHDQIILNYIATDDHFLEPSLLLPEWAPSKNTSDDCPQSTITPHLTERQAARSLPLLLKFSHASCNAYNSNASGTGTGLNIDETLTSHVERSHEHTPIDFALDHSFSSQIDHTDKDSESHPSRATSPELETRTQEDFTSSPPLSPSTNSAYMPSSSPIPSSSPMGLSFKTPPTSPPSSPVKDTQLEIWKNVSMEGRYAPIPFSGFADQHNSQSMISPEVSTLHLQHQEAILSPSDHNVESPRVTPIATLSDATTPNTESKARLSKESDVEQKRLDSDVDAHQLKSMNAIPYPKRPTIAAHRLQQKKLAQPFRSPVLLQVPKVEPKPKASATDLRVDTVVSRTTTPKEDETSQEQAPLSSPTLNGKIRYRTTRAATQFKSPLSVSNALDDSSLVRLTPTIQALERKLQILKRAVKVREDVQEEVLEGLVKKWSEAGREVAWEVWNLVKDNVNSDGGHGNSQSSNQGKKRTFEGSWGCSDAKRLRGEERERNWGWDVVPISGRSEDEEGGDEEPKHSLGTMLMQLGVAVDTLGWNEEEGTFIDK